MKITQEFIENSMVTEVVFDTMNGGMNDSDSEAFFNEIIDKYFDELKNISDAFLKIVTNLKEGKYQEARKGFSIRDNFFSLTKDICRLRVIIKSLLWGIIKTSGISKVEEIEIYKNEWKRYDDFDKDNHSYDYHHYIIYRQFREVNNTEELQIFNVFFHQYLVEMLFKMCEILIRRMNFTLQFLQFDKTFENSCREAGKIIKEFREEIEKLKKV